MTWNRDTLETLLHDLAELPEEMDLELAQARPESIRHFDAAERDALTPAACGYLLELHRRSLISRDELELVIHSIASRVRPPVDRQELSDIVDHLLLGTMGTDLPPASPFDRAH